MKDRFALFFHIFRMTKIFFFPKYVKIADNSTVDFVLKDKKVLVTILI